MKKRESYIEFARIIACISIIFAHTHFYNNNYAIKLVTGQCGVPLFFMITGYVLFNKNHDYKKILNKVIFKFIIPVFILTSFSVLFSDWILGEKTIISCITSIKLSNFIQPLLGVILLTFPDYRDILSQLWFFRDYIPLLISYPLLKSICPSKENKESTICRRIILIMLLLSIIIRDLNDLNIINVNSMATYSIIYVLIGYEIKLHKDSLINNNVKKIIIISFLISIGLLLRQTVYTIDSQIYMNFLNRQNLPTIMYTTGLFILFLNIGLVFKESNSINYIAHQTYEIYLIHYLIIAKFKTTNFYAFLNNKVLSFNYHQQFILEIVYTLIIFIISLIIVIVIKEIMKITKKIHLKKIT